MWKPVATLVLGIILAWVPWVTAQTGADARRAADQFMLQAVQQFQQRQYTEAFQSWQQALALYQALGDQKRQAWTLQNLGTAALELKQAEQAKAYFMQSLTLARTLQDASLEGDLLEKLGRVYRVLGDYQGALDIYQQLLKNARATGDRENEILALGSLGNLYRALKDNDNAIAYLRQALVVARQHNDRAREKIALGSLGEAYLSKELYANAVESFWQASVIAREQGDRSGQIVALRQLGKSYYFLGEYAKALTSLEQSLQLAQEQGDKREQMHTLQSLGSVFYALGQLDKAIAYYQQDLALARALQHREGEGTALGNLALVYSQRGEYGTALDYYKQDLAIARESGDRLVEGQALANMGLALFKAGNLAQAETALRDAVHVLDSVREKVGGMDAYNISLFETHLRPYRYLQTTLIAQGRTAEALHVSEQGRGRALLALLGRCQSPPAGAQRTVVVPGLREIQQIAQTRGVTVVEYALIPDESALYIWVVQPTGSIVFQQVNLPQSETGLVELVGQARKSLGVGGRGLVASQGTEPQQDDKALTALFRLLVQPVAQYFPTDPEALIVFIPQGPLFLVPFHALRDDAGQYLLERHTVLTAPSLQTLQLAHTNHTSHKADKPSALVVGNPVMPSIRRGPETPVERLSSLPGAEREARAIATLFKQEALTGERATKQTVLGRMREARVIHLATHGLLDDIKWLGVPGAIALAPVGEDDGLLTAAEIMDLRLKADLVVLSACDTAQGTSLETASLVCRARSLRQASRVWWCRCGVSLMLPPQNSWSPFINTSSTTPIRREPCATPCSTRANAMPRHGTGPRSS